MCVGSAMRAAGGQNPESIIIVVDDDEAVRDGLRFLIRSVNIPIETYASAEEMLDAKSAGNAGCIIVDVNLPGMDGFELCDQLRELDIDKPIVFITGRLKKRSRARASKLGAFAFLEKPIDADLMLRTVQKAVQRTAECARSETQPV